MCARMCVVCVCACVLCLCAHIVCVCVCVCCLCLCLCVCVCMWCLCVHVCVCVVSVYVPLCVSECVCLSVCLCGLTVLTSCFQYPKDRESGNSKPSGSPQLELSFEYLMSKDTLRWISIISDQVRDCCSVWSSVIVFFHHCHPLSFLFLS